MKNKSIYLIVSGVIAVVFLGKQYLTSKFDTGQCVQALDGYIWHINRFNFGTYYLMGWQGKSWGNETPMDKSALERESAGIPVYHEIPCPEYSR